MEQAEPSPPARLPWDFHPALTEERLRICGRMLANARRDALAMARYEMGDDAWSVGCRAFAFGRHRLARAAGSGDFPWLEVLDDSTRFVFGIGGKGHGVPVRFHRSGADEPAERPLKRQETEVQQLSLALSGTEAEDLAFRLVVETDGTGRVGRVVFLALRGEDRVECFWPVPLEMPAEVAAGGAVQLRLIADDGYAGPGEPGLPPDPAPGLLHGSPPGQPHGLSRRKPAVAPVRPQTTLL